MDFDVQARLSALERRCARQRIAMLTVLSAAIAIDVMLYVSGSTFAQPQRTDEILTVRGLVVVDDRGVERVRIGAPLPDPTFQGKRVPRKGVVSGILIFDDDGDERGGYVVSENGDAFLTLDAKKEQQALFIANRDGGANLAIWSGNTKSDNFVSVRAVPVPMIEIVHNGKSVFRAGGADAFSK